MDRSIKSARYDFYDMESIDACVESERDVIEDTRPDVVIGDMRPTLQISAGLMGLHLAMVEAAYNSPSYGHRIQLPTWFETEPGPFEEYLRRCRSSPAKRKRSCLLVADVPQFHPTGQWKGAYYVGPLLDLPARPRQVVTLDSNGWDSTLPLIYLNCGSTGHALEGFLIDTLSVLSERYRVICTVLGPRSREAAPTTPSRNVRIVDFLPASWITAEASAVITVGGAGTVYHALRSGVPVVGAADHLDQEYHLNRVGSLGLGIKLEWNQWTNAEEIRKTVDRVIENQEYEERCRAFSRHVREWDNVDRVSQVIEEMVDPKEDPRSGVSGGLHRVSETTFVKYLRIGHPLLGSKGEVHRLLAEARRAGMPSSQESATPYDLLRSWNWLHRNSSTFFEAEYRAQMARRQRFLFVERGSVQTRQDSCVLRLKYRVSVQAGTSSGRVLLFVPFPIQHRRQRDIKLRSVEPEAMRNHLLSACGLFYGFGVDLEPGGSAEVGYCCDLRVNALRSGEMEVGLLAAPYSGEFMSVPPSIADDRRIREVLVGVAGSGSDIEKARALYDFIRQGKRFEKTEETCQCLECSTYQALDGGSGMHCITAARAFISLCRLAGIPAREVSGALLGYPLGHRFVCGGWRETPFAHTWAEVFVEGRWLSVEFHSMVIGLGGMNGRNCKSRRLRTEAEQEEAPFEEYYFGSLDLHRVVCSNAVKQIPHVLWTRPDAKKSQDSAWWTHLEAEILD